MFIENQEVTRRIKSRKRGPLQTKGEEKDSQKCHINKGKGGGQPKILGKGGGGVPCPQAKHQNTRGVNIPEKCGKKQRKKKAIRTGGEKKKGKNGTERIKGGPNRKKSKREREKKGL